MLRVNRSTKGLFEALQHTFISEDLLPEVPSLSSSGATHHQEEQMKHWGNEMHTNGHSFPLRSRGFFKPVLPSAKDTFRELVVCCPEFMTNQVSLVCHVPFPHQPFRLQFTDSSDATID